MYKYENGKRKFNNDVVRALAEYYNTEVSDTYDTKKTLGPYLKIPVIAVT